MAQLTDPVDVLVLGGGNAALCAAVRVSYTGIRVLRHHGEDEVTGWPR